MSLRNKAIRGASWSLAGSIIKNLITFIIGIILARLLNPTEYGLVGMAGVFIFVTYVFIDSGFSTALIQRSSCTSVDLSTIFYINLVISLFFFLLLYLTASPIANFYSEPQLISIIRVLGFLIILYALSIVHRSIIIREINFKLLNIIEVTAQILSGIIAVIMAYKGYGVWSLVWKSLLNQLFVNIQFWIFNKWYPTIEFSLNSLKEMFSFSSKLLVSGIINKIYEQIYNLIIGKFFSAGELGLFTRANQFKNLPSQSISGAIMSVSFPIFAQVQNDLVRLKHIAKKIIKATMFFNISAMLGMLAISDNLILALIGEKWIEATPYLQLLCIVGLFYPLHPINLNIITSLGRSDLFLRLEIVKKLFAIPVIIIGILTSVKIMIIGMVVSSVIALFINSHYTRNLINYGLREQLSDISGSFILGIIMSSLVFITGIILKSLDSKIILLLIQIFIGVCVVILLSSVAKMKEYNEFKEIFINRVLRKD